VLVGILDVSQKEDLMITCRSGVTIRMPVVGISEQGRATQGVKLIRLDDSDEIAAITALDEHEVAVQAIVAEQAEQTEQAEQAGIEPINDEPDATNLPADESSEGPETV